MSALESTYTDLCEAAALNVRGVAQTVHHVLVAVGPDKRSSQTVVARLRKLARDQGLSERIVFSQGGLACDGEYSFRLRS